MRQKLEHWLNQIWYHQKPVPFWLRALSVIYTFGFQLDRHLGRARQPEDLKNMPIVVVGNLTAGGSGKTPLVIRLCQLFRQAGLQPGVVSRGYGRQSGNLIEVTAASTAAEVGDEALLIARRGKVPVVVATNRCDAARFLFSQGVDLVVSDDGLQHHRMPRSIEICVVDAERGLGNRYPLPAGPLRESSSRLTTVDFVVLNGEEKVLTEVPGAVPMSLLPGLLYALDSSETWRLTQFTGCRVHAVAGIGNPERFFRTLQHAGLQTIEHVFADHHAFTASDFAAFESNLPVIMTEKDAVKCRELGLKNAWFLAVDASLPVAWESELMACLNHKMMEYQGT